MKVNRIRVGAVTMVASLALAGFGVGLVSAAGPAETGTEATSAETATTGVEADGVGGHADTPGVDVNHEFNGQE